MKQCECVFKQQQSFLICSTGRHPVAFEPLHRTRAFGPTIGSRKLVPSTLNPATLHPTRLYVRTTSASASVCGTTSMTQVLKCNAVTAVRICAEMSCTASLQATFGDRCGHNKTPFAIHADSEKHPKAPILIAFRDMVVRSACIQSLLGHEEVPPKTK